MSKNLLEKNHPYYGVVTILENAQNKVNEVIPALASASDPKDFATTYNQKVAQAIQLMTAKLAEHGRTKTVSAWSMSGSVKVLLACIEALTNGASDALPIPNINHDDADDTTFKLCVVYLSVLKGLNVELCPSAKDYIAVLSWAGKAWLDNLTINSPKQLTQQLINYFKNIADEARRQELLAFVGEGDLGTQLRHAMQDTIAAEVTTKLEEIKKSTSISDLPWRAMSVFKRRARQATMNVKGHVLITVRKEENIPNDLSKTQTTIVKILKSSVAQYRAYQYEWATHFVQKMSPSEFATFRPSEEMSTYEAGFIRVQCAETGVNNLYYWDKALSSQTTQWNGIDCAQFDALVGIHEFGVFQGLTATQLDNISNRIGTVNGFQLKGQFVHFELNHEKCTALPFPNEDSESCKLAYDATNIELYRKITQTRQLIDRKKYSQTESLSDRLQAVCQSIENLEQDIQSMRSGSSVPFSSNVSSGEASSTTSPTLSSGLTTLLAGASEITTVVMGYTVLGHRGVLTKSLNEYVVQPLRASAFSSESTLEYKQNALEQMKNVRVSMEELLEIKEELSRLDRENLSRLSADCRKYVDSMTARMEKAKQRGFQRHSVEDAQSLSVLKKQIDALRPIVMALNGRVLKLNVPDILSRDLYQVAKHQELVTNRFTALNAAYNDIVEQNRKVTAVEQAATDFTRLMLNQTFRLGRELTSFKMQVLNSRALPYFALLSGAIALTITMGILLSNSHFAVFVLLGMGLTQPLAIVGAAAGGVIAVAGGAKILSNCFFKSKSEDSRLSSTSMAATASV